MKDKLFRFRRAAFALIAGVGTVGGVVAGASGISGAATSNLPTGSTISAASAPTIASTGVNQAAGNLTLTLASGAIFNIGDTITLNVASTSGTIVWSQNPTVTAPNTTGSTTPTFTVSGATTTSLVLTFTDASSAPSTAAQTITLSAVGYTTTSATGNITVTAVYAPAVGTFSPASGVANATLVTAPYFGLSAASTPTIGAGLTSQAAGNLNLSVYGAASTGWQQNNTMVIELDPTAGSATNCTGTLAAPIAVGLSATPTVTVTPTNGDVSTAPTVTASLGQANACKGSAYDNELILTFTNSGTLSQTTTNTAPAVVITLSGISYSVGSGTPIGLVNVTAAYASTANAVGTPGSTFASNGTTPLNGVTGASPGPSDAVISDVVVGANNPAVSMSVGAINTPISNITITEAAAGTIPTGYVCLTLTSNGGPLAGAAFTASSTPAVAVTSGNATVNTTVSGVGTTTLSFNVTASSSTASVFTLSKLAANAPTGAYSGPVFLAVSDGNGPTCGNAPFTTGTVAAFTVGGSTAIYGSTADGTAAAELEHVFNPSTGGCVDGTVTNGLGTARYAPVILATDANYPDALAAGYLAGQLHTGVLLTPTNSLSPEAMQALRLEGITNVFIVGGPLAVSNAVQTQLQATPAYNCGGNAALTSLLGTAQNIQVTRIYGQTEYGTAADIAQYGGASAVHQAAFAGAFGMYNDTTGTSSSAPATSAPVPTAILATSQGAADAVAASALSYYEQFPILLTSPASLSTDAQNAMQALGIKQVIVMGGPIAISNSVVTSLTGMGISVLRIAGQDYTDTAAQLASFEVNNSINAAGNIEGLSLNPNHTVIAARGDFYTDGLAGSVVAASGATYQFGGNFMPVLLTLNPTTVGKYLTSFLNTAGSPAGIDGISATVPGAVINNITVLGGPLAVAPTTISAMQSALNG